MIYYISGKIVEKNPACVVVENNGVAYHINIPLSTYENVGENGEEVKLFTHLILTDNDMQLYGFYTKEEREFFKLLINVPGIGPKFALRILSGLSISQLYQAILEEDASFLCKIPGIGRKTGERLIVELKEQMKKITIPSQEEIPEIFSDAVEALCILGYKKSEAVSAVSKTIKEMKEEKIKVEDLIKEALKRL